MRHLVFTSGYTEPIRLGSGEIVPGRCRGISAFVLEEDGSLCPLGCSPSVPNPSYLTVRGDRLYCVSERKDFYGMPSSTSPRSRPSKANKRRRSAMPEAWRSSAFSLLESGRISNCHLAQFTLRFL
jgi:hypothetical protein